MQLMDAPKFKISGQQYARALRAIGQDIAVLLPENLEIVLEDKTYSAHGRGRDISPEPTTINIHTPLTTVWKKLVHHGSKADPVRPQVILVPFFRSYTPQDIDRLEELGIAQRTNKGGLPDIYSLGERLRTIGRIVDSNEWQLVKLRKDSNTIFYEYRDLKGETHAEELSNLALYRLQQQYYTQRTLHQSKDPWER